MPWRAAVPRVMVSAPVPPMMVSTLLTVPVLAPLARVSCVGAGAEVDGMPVVSAAPRVTVSAPVPPVMVSTLVTVRGVGDVAKGQRCRCRRRDRCVAVAEPRRRE